MPNHPDSDIFPHATGRAIEVVSAHKQSHDLVLYGSWFCPFVQRVWIALELKSIPYQWIETNPYNKPESLMSLNPRGLIPTLSFHGKPIYESSVILQLLEDAYPTHKPSLLPDDPYEKAYARLWMDFVGTRIVPAFHRYLQHEGNDKEGLNKARQEYLDKWREFQGAMKDGGGPFFLGGDNPSLVDVAAAPWVQRHWVLDEMKGPFEVPAEFSRWKNWEQAVLNLDEVKKTESEKEPTRGIYKKYADNTAQSEAAKAIREGRAIP